MNTLKKKPLISSFLHLVLAIKFLIILQARNGLSGPEDMYQSCVKTFSCGDNITEIGYPFRRNSDPEHCGHPNFVLTCHNEKNNTTNIEIMGVEYRVLEIAQTTQTMTIAREDVMEEACPTEMKNTTLDYSTFNFGAVYLNITFLYGCPPPHVGGNFVKDSNSSVPCGNNGEEVYITPGNQGLGMCRDSVIVPAPVPPEGATQLPNITELDRIMRQGFLVRWTIGSQLMCSNCTASKGRCGYDLEINKTVCYCPTSPHVSNTSCTMAMATSPPANMALPSPPPPPPPETGRGNSTKVIALSVTGAVLAGVFFGWFVFYCRQRSKKHVDAKSAIILSKEMKKAPSSKGLLAPPSPNFTHSIPSYPSSSVSDLGRGSSYFGAQLFNYTELEEATNNFDPSRELGDGGFGTVYYGVLPDGREIAVKRLYENNFKRVEQFMNEVEILTRLRHQNLVKLYGCTSKRSRELLLVYEYISNGTVADHLHGKRAKSGLLSWPVRLKIAIQTAEALSFLHKSDTIHRDVKTTNILLDNNFHVKVADFGLSRLFPNDVTHVSTAPQGTPGYVDPEYYQCYKLTEKSDVYSFGVVLIELISSLRAVDTERHRHDINLANMAVNKIQNQTLHELVDKSLGFEKNGDLRRMVTLVSELAFRCLQQEREMRPSMVEVLEGLKGIENEDLNAHKVEIVDMSMDDDAGLLNGFVTPTSPD
ncbi:hypothetical protein ACP275_12G029600 [Erythranthe tilingii]